jgi:hypothetical protein
MKILILIVAGLVHFLAFGGDNFQELNDWSIRIGSDISLPVKSQSTSMKTPLCSLRSLESYPQDETIKAGARYNLVLKNFNPQAKTWVFILRSLYSGHEEKSFDKVGEYKIVNLDYNDELKYLLIVGRNFFKQPMYAIIHCHGVAKNFSVEDLERETGGVFSTHKISVPHW